MQGLLLDDYDFVHFPENLAAAQRAYDEAGIRNPRQDIDLAEVHDCFTITELIIYEDLGFSPRGKAREDVEAGSFTVAEGDLPVNPDGGLKCFGHPIGARRTSASRITWAAARAPSRPRWPSSGVPASPDGRASLGTSGRYRRDTTPVTASSIRPA
jgi:acetyl-CoA C-acetyltransferase